MLCFFLESLMKKNSFIFSFNWTERKVFFKFLSTATLLIFILIYIPLAVLLAYFPYISASTHTITSQYQKKIVSQKMDDPVPQTIVIGDSGAASSINAALLPETLSLTSWAASPFEMSSLLHQYLEHNKPPKCVILGMHYFTEHTTKKSYLDVIFVGNIPDWPELLEFYLLSKKLNDFPSTKISFAEYILNFIGYKIYFFGNYTRGLTRIIFNQNYARTSYNDYLMYLKNHRGSLSIEQLIRNSRSDIFGKMIFNNFEPHAIYDFYLQKIADDLIKYNIRLELVFPPYNSELSNSFAFQKYKSDLFKHLKLIFKGTNLSTTFYDPIPLSQESFAENVHTNESGAEKYTNFLNKNHICKEERQGL